MGTTVAAPPGMRCALAHDLVILCWGIALCLVGCSSATVGDGPFAGADAGLGDREVDAAIGCGDGVITGSESCDPPGSCPRDCPSLDSCTPQVLTGDPDDCTAVCEPRPVEACIGGDGCCPETCDFLSDSDCSPVDLIGLYTDSYTAHDLGTPPGVPSNCGALLIDGEEPNVLLIAGDADESTGALYALPLVRNPLGAVVGFSAPATQRIAAPYIDSGLIRGPAGTTVTTRWPNNELGVSGEGSAQVDQVIDLGMLGVASSPGGAALVPVGQPNEGALKLVSWPDGEWYGATISRDLDGAVELSDVAQTATLVGGPLGIAYVRPGSPHVADGGLLVAEYENGALSIYDIDADGDPMPGTRRLFVENLDYPTGVTFDPVTGDLLFCSSGGTDRVTAIRGFARPQ